MILHVIMARAKNGVIGNKGALPWSLPADLRRFKELTINSTVVMGRKTWESLPSSVRPLPRRRNIVVSRNAEYSALGADTVTSLADVLAIATTEHVYVIGGAELYAAALPSAERLHLTDVNAEPEGDTFSPAIDLDAWDLQTCEHWQDDSGVWHRFLDYTRSKWVP